MNTYELIQLLRFYQIYNQLKEMSNLPPTTKVDNNNRLVQSPEVKRAIGALLLVTLTGTLKWWDNRRAHRKS